MQISVHLLKKAGGLDPGLANDCRHFFAFFVFSLFISETPNPLHIMDFVPWSMKRQICVHSRFRFFFIFTGTRFDLLKTNYKIPRIYIGLMSMCHLDN